MPEPSAPTTSGSWRLAKAMPRQPQTSMWLRPTARMRIFNADGSEAAMCGNGLRCVARNHRCRGGEIDLVMQSDETLVFVEVRLPAWHRIRDSCIVEAEAARGAQIVDQSNIRMLPLYRRASR